MTYTQSTTDEQHKREDAVAQALAARNSTVINKALFEKCVRPETFNVSHSMRLRRRTRPSRGAPDTSEHR